EQWLGLCRMTEGEEESFGVETMLEELSEPLRVVSTVALDEVKNYASRWSDAMHKEVKALLDAGALVPLTAEEQMKLEASGKIVVLPAKGVFTTKPPDVERTVDDEGVPLPRGSPHFVKRKARLVICGNFQGRQAREDSYAGGCQIDSLRAMLVLAAFRGWRLASTDIRNAFILAPIRDEEDDDDGGVQDYGADSVTSAYVMLGYRAALDIFDYGKVEQMQMCGEDEILLVQQWLTSEWKASDLTWATEDSVLRFLGLEIMLVKDGVKIGQQAFVEELIRHHKLQESKGYGTPCPQEWLLGECEESTVDYTPEQLRRAQTLTGELLWLSGRSRPDIMHSVSTMSSLCIRNPELVERNGLRVLGYLKATAEVCLWYRPVNSGYEVTGYSDASFAPLGTRSVGCSVACYLGCPVSWRCGRQSIVSLSVAEAELLEAVNCVQLMLGLSSFVEELQHDKPRHCLRVDNQAAVGLTTESSGTWKTRHLRVRAFALREAVRQEELRISHIEGLRQLGDLGTKCFHKPRLEQLRDLWGLWDGCPSATTTGASESSSTTTTKASIATSAVNDVTGTLARLTLILGWLVQGSRASDDGPKPNLELSFAWELYGLAILAVIAAIGVWELMKWLLGRRFGARDDFSESKEARRLRKLQQVVHEDVGKYGLEVGVKVSSSTGPATPQMPVLEAREERPSSSRARLVTRGSQSDPFDDGMRQHAGPFFASEQGDRIHHDPNCRGLRNAVHRTRRLTLCAYCYQRCPLYVSNDL
ncbi:GIP, partial [Symbiodinium sp. CCMP2592]